MFIASFSLFGETFFFKVITEIQGLEEISAVQGVQIVQEYLSIFKLNLLKRPNKVEQT